MTSDAQLDRLPEELITHIASYCEAPEVLSLRSTNRSLEAATQYSLPVLADRRYHSHAKVRRAAPFLSNVAYTQQIRSLALGQLMPGAGLSLPQLTLPSIIVLSREGTGFCDSAPATALLRGCSTTLEDIHLKAVDLSDWMAFARTALALERLATLQLYGCKQITFQGAYAGAIKFEKSLIREQRAKKYERIRAAGKVVSSKSLPILSLSRFHANANADRVLVCQALAALRIKESSPGDDIFHGGPLQPS